MFIYNFFARFKPIQRFSLCVSLALASTSFAQVCVVPQNNGLNVSTVAGQVVNGFFTPANGIYNAGSAYTFAVSDARGSSTWAAGDMALIIQMQCVDINASESDNYGDGGTGRPAHGYLETPAGDCKAGQYEFAPVGTASLTSIQITAPLQKRYVQADPTNTSTRRSFQIVRVPQYGNLTLGGNLTALEWNGLNGGVLALDVAKTLDLGGQTFDMAAKGFRGGGGRPIAANGANPNRYRASDPAAHAAKAEGIAGTPALLFTDVSPFDRNEYSGAVATSVASYVGYPGTSTIAGQYDFDFARGAPGNAGGGGQYFDGGYHNGGGGGGANGGQGGRGAFGWRAAGWAGVAADYSNIETVTGQHLAAYGGAAFGGAGISRVVMGGGGGAGDQNGNSIGLAYMSGGTGGGIVMVRAGKLVGNGMVDVRGGVANTNTLNDAAGAGAAGGSVVLVAPNWTSGVVTVNGQGGQGGDAWIGGGSAHSGGGGGGGGVVVRTGAISADLSGGINGITNIGDAPPGGADHGALPGTVGVDFLIAAASDPVTNAGYLCMPQADVAVSKSVSPTAIGLGATATFTLVVSNYGPQTATNTQLIDTLPIGLNTLTWVAAPLLEGGATIVGTSLLSLTSFAGTLTLPINSTVTLLLKAVGASAANAINTATVAVANTLADNTLSNNIATASVVVGPTADLQASKVASTSSLNVGQTTNFILTFSNAGPSDVSFARLIDTLPTTMGTLSFVSASGSGGATLTSSTVAGTSFSGTATLPANSTLIVIIRAVAGTPSSVFNTASIAAPGSVTDIVSSNNIGTVFVLIGPLANLSISKSATPTLLVDGQTTSFTLIARNTGPTAVTNATIKDILPSGLSGIVFLSAAGVSGGTLTARATSSSQFNGTVTLPVNSSITIVFSAAAGGIGEQVNRVTLTVPVGISDPDPSDNVAQATVTIPVPALLSITKSDGTSSVGAGASVNYTIVVSNDGPNSAANALIKDPTAAGLVCTSLSCIATGGAICPSPLTVGLLQGSGLSIPAFPANSTVLLLLNCHVSATGL